MSGLVDARSTDPALRVLPHSTEAEQGLLGSLLQDGAALHRLGDAVSATAFFNHAHGLIFSAIEAIVRRGQPVDVITVYDELEGETADYGGIAYLNALAQSVPSATNLHRYAEIVREHAALRSVVALTDSIASRAFSGRCGVANLLDDARTGLSQIELAGQLKSRRIPLLTPVRLQEVADAARWLVKHVIPADSIGMLYGASGTFKSFITLDLVLHVVHGLPWLGRKTAQGAVIYIAAEGGSGLWPRVHAWHRMRNLPWEEAPLYVMPVALDLRADAWRVVEAAQAIGVAPAMVVVDTLSQTFNGEENSANEVAAYLREIGQRFRALWGCAVVLVHHSGHSATERPRGSSAMRANVDFMLGVFRDEKEMLATLTCEKQKDGDLFEDATFSLTVHALGTDPDGDRITSLVARHLSNAEDLQDAMENERGAGRGGKNQLLLSLVQNGMEEAGLRKAFYADCGLDSAESRRQAYHRARKWASKQGFIEIAQGRVITLKSGPAL